MAVDVHEVEALLSRGEREGEPPPRRDEDGARRGPSTDASWSDSLASMRRDAKEGRLVRLAEEIEKVDIKSDLDRDPHDQVFGEMLELLVSAADRARDAERAPTHSPTET